MLLGLVGLKFFLLALWIRGTAMKTVERRSSSLFSFGLQFVQSESLVSRKTSDLSPVWAWFQGVLAFSVVSGMLEDFCPGPGREQNPHSAGMSRRR